MTPEEQQAELKAMAQSAAKQQAEMLYRGEFLHLVQGAVSGFCARPDSMILDPEAIAERAAKIAAASMVHLALIFDAKTGA